MCTREALRWPDVQKGERRCQDVHKQGESVARHAQVRRDGGMTCTREARRWHDVHK